MWTSVVMAPRLESTGSVVGRYGLSCAETCGWDLPRSGIEPMPPALAGGFLPLSHQESEAPLLFLFCLSLSSQKGISLSLLEQGKGPAGCAREGGEWRVVSEEPRTDHLLNRGDRLSPNCTYPLGSLRNSAAQDWY